MYENRARSFAIGCWLIAGVLLAVPASAQDGKDDQQTLRQLIERLEKVEAELARLKADGKQPTPAADRFLTLLETPFYGSTNYYNGSNAPWYFAAKVVFVNLTSKDVTIQREDLVLDADGQTKTLGEIPANLRNNSFRVGNQSFQISNLKTPEKITVPAGRTTSSWVFYHGLPKGPKVPDLQLKWTSSDKPGSLNVNEFALGLLGLDIKRIGPHAALGLLTIDGEFNSINAGEFSKVLDKLAADKVSRVVIRWGDAAAPLESDLSSWLQQGAMNSGNPQAGRSTSQRFPALPATIRELHLVTPPGNRTTYSSSYYNAANRIHKMDVDAISAALRSVYEILPRNELLQEIQQGELLTRSAALSAGGGRLSAEHLPLILELADDDQPKLQQAALVALRHFGEPEAVAKLVALARKNTEPLASVAVRSLAGSRYATAHEALLELLKNEPPASRAAIVKVLIEYPRPIWSETIYEFTRDNDPKVRVEALRALVRIGHPKIYEVLEQALETGDESLRNEAFTALVGRTDPQSEALAMRHALKELETKPPTSSQLQMLLQRTKDQRAVPLLLQHFRKNTNNSRTTMINILQQIGDESIAKEFLKEYPRLNDYEKSAVLKALVQLQSPEFKKLAPDALLSSNSSMVSAACAGLQEDGGPDATKLLAEAMEKSGNTSAWSYISSALGSIGSAEARIALVKARASSNENKRNYALNALRSLYQRSPGYQFVLQGNNLSKQDKHKDAVAQFTQAINADKSLPEGYIGRANCYLRLKKYDDASSDFETGMKLDPYNSLAVTGRGIALVQLGKTDEGIQLVEKAAGKFPNEWLYSYNTSCVYGIALEKLNADKDATDREKKSELYKKRALEELNKSLSSGFSDWNLLRTDPDLNSLRDFPEFQQIEARGGKPATTPGKPPGAADAATSPFPAR